MPLPVQLERLKRAYPQGRGTIRKNCLLWTCEVQPTEWSARYEILIDHKFGAHPSVHVVSPRLEGPDRLPHVYPNNRLCLFLPGEWHDDELLARTIMPWATEWLFHYEVWAAGAAWTGGGHEPDSTAGRRPLSDNRRKRSRRQQLAGRRRLHGAFQALRPARPLADLLNAEEASRPRRAASG